MAINTAGMVVHGKSFKYYARTGLSDTVLFYNRDHLKRLATFSKILDFLSDIIIHLSRLTIVTALRGSQ